MAQSYAFAANRTLHDSRTPLHYVNSPYGGVDGETTQIKQDDFNSV